MTQAVGQRRPHRKHTKTESPCGYFFLFAGCDQRKGEKEHYTTLYSRNTQQNTSEQHCISGFEEFSRFVFLNRSEGLEGIEEVMHKGRPVSAAATVL